MTFRSLNLELEYRSTYDNYIIDNFYIPTFKYTKIYKRAVGYFSSSSLIHLTKGINHIVKNEGRMQFIVSPELTESDLLAIKEGYEKRTVINNRLIESFKNEDLNEFDKRRLSLLSFLIKNNYLDIKIAITKSDNKLGIFHEKLGILVDFEDNIICFTGSNNESANALSYNYECFDVYTSWEDKKRVDLKLKNFNSFWNNSNQQLEVYEFPKALEEEIFKDIKPRKDLEIDEDEKKVSEIDISIEEAPALPTFVNLYDYQKQAIDNWFANDCIGLFDMATGTGKTFTGLAAMVKKFEEDKKLATIIVVPYTHLVEQWAEDLRLFNFTPIIGYSESTNKRWREELNSSVINFTLGNIDNMTFICTIGTFRSKYVQDQIKLLEKNFLFVVDEAHNMGTKSLANLLPRSAQYRLGLSATIERHRDEDGTNNLYEYFDKKVIEFKLDEAIARGFLTPYKYYPIQINLTEEEVEKYIELSQKLKKYFVKDESGSTKLSDKAKFILIERARIIAGAELKLGVLKDLLQDKTEDSHILIYSGSAKVRDKAQEVEEADSRFIDEVGRIVNKELKMYGAKFTSEENRERREDLIEHFTNNDNLQVLSAIKCLDEGVNIPSIKTAILLSSTTNPKEYIQRRGRVLRKLKDGKEYKKPFAEIYDFFVLPYPTEEAKNINKKKLNYFKSIVDTEYKRVLEFNKLALNTNDNFAIIREIEDSYDLFNYYNEEEELLINEWSR